MRTIKITDLRAPRKILDKLEAADAAPVSLTRRGEVVAVIVPVGRWNEMTITMSKPSPAMTGPPARQWLCNCGYMNTGTICTKCGEAQGAEGAG